MYYSILTLFCLKLTESFSSFHFSHTISYTSLHFNITKFPLTYSIRVSSLELYVHHITFSIIGQCCVPHNHLLYCNCNIDTSSHLLFTKALSSKFQECFGKVIYPLEEPLFFDNSIAAAQPDESEGFFGNSPQYIYIFPQFSAGKPTAVPGGGMPGGV